MPSSNPPNSNYAQAAGTYGEHSQKHTPDQRELEARVLLKSAGMMQDIQNEWDSINDEMLDDMIRYNRQIWMLFYDTALENPEGDRPDDLRSNIVNLANFVFKHGLDILAEPKKEKFDILIEINREIAAGLMAGARNDAAKKVEEAGSSEKKEQSQNAGSGASVSV